MENSSKKINKIQFNNLKAKIEKCASYSGMDADFHLVILNAMNPKLMSPADLDSFVDLERKYALYIG